MNKQSALINEESDEKIVKENDLIKSFIMHCHNYLSYVYLQGRLMVIKMWYEHGVLNTLQYSKSTKIYLHEMGYKDLVSLIISHTKITTKHLTPEIPLRLITPECKLWNCKPTEIPFETDPFWAFYWPGGQAITRLILNGGLNLNNRRVLDIGSGCGACSIAAAKLGTKTVTANDIDSVAVVATGINAELNNINVDTSTEDLLGTECKDWDTILIGDMFYDEQFSEMLFQWLQSLVKQDKWVIIGDPGRHGLTDKRRNSLKLLAEYELPENVCIENRGFHKTSVWQLRE